jgi:hypothetical protein
MSPTTLELLDFVVALGLLIVGLFVVALPFVRAIHLAGHAVAALVVADGATITLGSNADGRAFQIVGISIHVTPFSGSVGFCEPTGELEGWRRTLFDVAGPLASVVLAGVLTWLAGQVASGSLAFLAIWGCWWLATAQAILSIAPTVVPSWWHNAYAGTTSDLHAYYPERFIGVGLLSG